MFFAQAQAHEACGATRERQPCELKTANKKRTPGCPGSAKIHRSLFRSLKCVRASSLIKSHTDAYRLSLGFRKAAVLLNRQ